eukprot:TRINITY_DN31031_c0_g1_i1.p1 TRINITY_DN31031_c0_g1~~TRINITY_DN31031_c0_g1_i1.p1  ORF type:complete len:275 (+),score=28.03 TRINITY_DN31031_c0_g1_i1:38-862(+)
MAETSAVATTAVSSAASATGPASAAGSTAASGGILACLGSAAWWGFCCTGCAITTALVGIGLGVGIALPGKKLDPKYCRPGDKCGQCQEAVPTVVCHECEEVYCRACCLAVHAKGYRTEHRNFEALPNTDVFGTGNYCGECDLHVGRMYCAICEEVYCVACCASVHRRGLRRLHRQLIRIGQIKIDSKTDTEEVQNAMKALDERVAKNKEDWSERKLIAHLDEETSKNKRSTPQEALRVALHSYEQRSEGWKDERKQREEAIFKQWEETALSGE